MCDHPNAGSFAIGPRRVGEGERVFIVAEIGINHQGRRDLALELVARAAAAGADAVKFQKRSLPDLYDPDLLAHPERHERAYQYLIPILKETELSSADYEAILAECRRLGILFLCTPWDRPSADFVDSLGVPAFKIASTDCTNHDLIDHVAAKGKPVLLSTGASTLDEVRGAADLLCGRGVPFLLFHCNCTYPVAPADVNLRNLLTLRETFGAPVGYSGHERGTAVAVAAVALGACAIEKHLTLDAAMPGPDHRASLEPAEFRRLVEEVRTVEAALGSRERRVTQGEVLNREALGKSVIAARAIRAGETIARAMLAVRGPGKGLPPNRLPELIGRTAPRDLAAGEWFRAGDLAPARRETLEARPAGNWGVVVRVGDGELAREHRAPVQEVHLTPADLDVAWKPKHSGSRLVVHAPEYADEGFMDPASLDDAVRRRSIALLRRVVAFTRRIAPSFSGKPAIVIHPGGMSLEPLGREERRLQLKRFGDALLNLEHKDIDLLPENLPPCPWYFGGQWVSNVFTDAEEIERFLRETGFGLCLDVSHAKLACNASGERLEEFVGMLAPFVRHLHISDARGLNGEGLQIGEGDIDFKTVFERLKGYSGTWIPEIWRGHQNGGAGFVTALNRLTPMMSEFEPKSSGA